MKTKANREPRRTFGTLFPGATKMPPDPQGRSSWRIGGSGVSGVPEDAYWTRAIMDLLESRGIHVKATCVLGICAADVCYRRASFLGGDLYAETGNYFGGQRGAWVTGDKAALFVALALGIRVPRKVLKDHKLEGLTLEQLESELRSELSQPSEGISSSKPKG